MNRPSQSKAMIAVWLRPGYKAKHRARRILLNGACAPKFNAEEVCEIRRRYAAGEKQVHLAKEFGVSQTVLSFLINRKTYADVE